jgi:4,5-DOPA dioxygenase extradiol
MLPTLFVSHGSPMLAIEPGVYGAAWQAMTAGLPVPDAILMVSAHWTTRQPALSAATQPDTIHDFGGFPAALYDIRYPAPGAPELATRTAGLLAAAGMPVAVAPDRGLDHGAWVPLQQMYPGADVPVTQLSVQPGLDAAWHLRLGEALRPLRRENVLVVASGGLTHNLYEFRFDESGSDVADDYVRAFQDWMHAALVNNDREALEHWSERAPQARRAHPTPEHLLPLFVAYGAAGERPRAARRLDNYSGRALAMDCYVFGD